MIEVPVKGNLESKENLERAILLLKRRCISTRLISDMNKHRQYEKPSTRRRKKHLKAEIRARDKDKKMRRKSMR